MSDYDVCSNDVNELTKEMITCVEEQLVTLQRLSDAQVLCIYL